MTPVAPERGNRPVTCVQWGAVRARAAGHRQLLTGSAVLVVTAIVQAISGALFWLTAAQADTREQVGQATALFTSAQFVTYVAGLGLPVATARYAAGQDRPSHILFAWAAVATVIGSGILSIGYLLFAPADSLGALRDWHAPAGAALFALVVVGTALSLLLDVRLMTQRRWGLVLARAVVAAVGRFPMMAALGGGNRAVVLLIAALAPYALTGIIGTLALPLVTGGRHGLWPLPSASRSMVRYSAVNWLSTLSYQAPSFILPLIVLMLVDAEDNADFYVAWGVAALACYVPTAISQALLAEGGRGGAHLRSQVRLTIVVAGGLMVAGTLLAAAGRDLVTNLYGDEYDGAAKILPVLVAGSIPWAVTSVYLTEARVLHRSGPTIAISLALTVGILGSAALLIPRQGIEGAGLAFLGGNTVAAMVALSAHRSAIHHLPRPFFQNRAQVLVPGEMTTAPRITHVD